MSAEAFSWNKFIPVLNIHWKDWCWSWNSNTVATWCKELTHWKRPWCWERLKVGGEGDDRGWEGWMVSLTQWTWVWVNSGIWWWTGKPGVLQFMGSQRVRHDWGTELNWASWHPECAFTHSKESHKLMNSSHTFTSTMRSVKTNKQKATNHRNKNHIFIFLRVSFPFCK